MCYSISLSKEIEDIGEVTMIRRKEYIIEQLQSPVFGQFVLTFLEASRRRMKQVSKSRNKTYTSIESASNNGFHSDYITPVINQSIEDGIHAALVVDTLNSPNRLRDEHLKNTFRQYLLAV